MIKYFKLFEEQLKLFPTEEFFQLKHKEDYLYHVSNIKNLDSIKNYGILPDFGPTIRNFYSEYYIFDVDEREEDDERIPIYEEIDGVSFFSETPSLGFCDPGIGLSNVKWENIVLCIVKKNDTIYQKQREDKLLDFEGNEIDYAGNISLYNIPLFIEGEDWFTFEEQTPEFILYGDELKKFIKKNFPESIKQYHLTEGVSNSQTIPIGEKWYHFTDFDNIEINPNPVHSDPAGIYMFPESELDVVKGYWRKKKYRFTIEIKPNLNILNLDTITKVQELEIVKNLDTRNEREYNNFMKYINGESEYNNFWQYIRSLYGYTNCFKSRDEFMKLGYDGIYTKSKINSYEPQIVIFELKNLKIIKKEETKNIFLIKDYYDRIFNTVKKLLKEYNPDNFDIKIEDYTEYENRYSNNLYKYEYIKIVNGSKDFSISVKGFLSGDINVDISPHIRNYSSSMGVTYNIYDPNWEWFITQFPKYLKTAIDQIKME